MDNGRVSEREPRPRHTTMATALVIGGSVGVIVAVGEQLAGLQSLETRERVSEFLASSPGSDLGMSVSTALESLRAVLMILAGLCTAAAVLGWHAMQGGLRARLALAVLAVPIFLGGFAIGGFLTSLVAAGTALLFTGHSAMWYRGEKIPEPPPRPGRPAPRPDAPSGGAPPLPTRQPGRSTATLQVERSAPASAYDAPPEATARPDALVWACVLTWAFCSLAVVVMAASVVLMATNPDLVVEEMRRQDAGLTASEAETLTGTINITAAIIGAWSLFAMVLAVLAFRGTGWARSALLASAAVAGVVCLFGAAYSLVMLLPAAVALAAVVLLNRSEVRAWFAHRAGSRQPRA